MVELTLHEVQWSREHGHPVLVLRVEGEAVGNLSIALTPSDAQLLAPKPPSAAVERARLFGLLESATAAFGARLAEVRFRLDPGMVLTADLRYEAPDRAFSLPANFADALVLAKRTGAPMLIGEHDLRWIRAMQSPAETSVGAIEPERTSLARAITSFIESLEIDDLPGPPRHGS
jgi:bifunctional DNase/RNase